MNENAIYESERLIFRPLRVEDAPAVHKRWNELSRRRWFSFQTPEMLTYERAVQACESSISRFDCDIRSGRASFPIALKDTDEIIGAIAFVKVENEVYELVYDNVEIVFEIGENYQNKGYATEAVKAAIKLAFTRLCEAGAALKITGMAEHENLASCKVLEKSGFILTHATEFMKIYEIKG